MVTQAEFDQAVTRGERMRGTEPRAISARFDRRIHRLVIKLSSNIEIAFNSKDLQGLEHAKWPELADIEISPSGFGLHFPKLDADLYLPALLQGKFGSQVWMNAHQPLSVFV